jgi:orotidine-5'-phosphate decarboxylase
MNNSKIIVALDGLSYGTALTLAKQLSGQVWGFKFNDLLLGQGAVHIISSFNPYGKIFLDPKLHDIPNTIQNAIQRLARLGADLITVHASAGRKALTAATQVCADYPDTGILAITALTSLTDAEVKEIYRATRKVVVNEFAELADETNCKGIVCSATEFPYLRNYTDLIKVVPGVRPSGAVNKDDQAHTATPESLREADLIVVGRPITSADQPLEVVQRINAAMQFPTVPTPT